MHLSRSQQNVESEKHLSLHFVVPHGTEEGQSSETMKQVYQECCRFNLNCKWLPDSSNLDFKTTNKDIFVFEKFEGQLFDKVKSTKALIVGPRCLLTCLKEDISIPCCSYPVLSMAMRDLVVTTANVLSEKREELRNRVRSMGGTFSISLRPNVTHVVTTDVVHPKCPAAMAAKVPIMCFEWVAAVWEASQSRDVRATDPEFQMYKCSLFYGIIATTTNLSRKEKQDIMTLLDKNGGKCETALNGITTNLVIASKPKGDKYEYAKEHKIVCVTPEWVHKSVNENCLQAFTSFSLDPNKRCSTPEHEMSRFQPDFSTVSNITCNKTSLIPHYMDDTLQENTTIQQGRKSVAALTSNIDRHDITETRRGDSSDEKTIVPDKKEHNLLVEQLNVRQAKKLGTFLDGCKVYLSGFSSDQVDKLRRILNGGGATRYDEITECVTHVIVGDFVPADMKLLANANLRPHVVGVEWLVESINLGTRAPEDKFSRMQPQPDVRNELPSPLSKKGMAVLQHEGPTVSIAPPVLIHPAPMEEENPSDDLVQQYLDSQQGEEPPEKAPSSPTSSKGAATLPASNCTSSQSQTVMDLEQLNSSIFEGLVFDVDCFSDPKQEDEISLLLRNCSAKLDPEHPQYLVMPPLVGYGLKRRGVTCVNQLWLEDCVNEEKFLPIQYFHEVLETDLENFPLSGCVITVSSYSNRERIFLIYLAELLGAEHQSVFARKDCPEKDVKGVTHLVCNDSTTNKCKAAVRWNVPVVTHEWLLACAKESKHVSESPYMLSSTTQTKSVEKDTDVSKNIEVTMMSTTKSTETGEMGPPQTPVTARRITISNGSNSNSPTLKRRLTDCYKSPEDRLIGGNLFSQETPLRVPKGIGQSINLTPKGPWHINTPETPYGQVFTDNPSPETRKRWKKWIDSVPQFKLESPCKPRRPSTPLSELIAQCWKKIGANYEHREDAKNQNENCPSLNSVEHLEETPSPGPSATPVSDVPRDNMQQKTDFHLIFNEMKTNERVEDRVAASVDKENKTPDHSVTKLQRSSSQDISHSFTTDNVSSNLAISWTSDTAVSPSHIQEESEDEPELPRIFLLSSIEPAEKRKVCEEIITSLGGTLSDRSYVEPSVTHLICEKPLRSEKLLASIAAGKWVLHISYLHSSQEKGRFLKEEEFEWGNPSFIAQSSLVEPNTVMHQLAHAAYRWRKKVASGFAGAFAEMKFLILTKKQKTDQFKRLILAGGGQVVSITDWQTATVCIVDPANASNLKPISLATLAKHKIPCVPVIFLNNVLVTDPSPTPEEFALEEYKKLLCEGTES